MCFEKLCSENSSARVVEGKDIDRKGDIFRHALSQHASQKLSRSVKRAGCEAHRTRNHVAMRRHIHGCLALVRFIHLLLKYRSAFDLHESVVTGVGLPNQETTATRQSSNLAPRLVAFDGSVLRSDQSGAVQIKSGVVN